MSRNLHDKVEKQETPTICQISGKSCLVIKQELKAVYCFIRQVLYFDILNTSRVISA